MAFQGMQSDEIDVYIVDDEEIVCESLSLLLGTIPGYSVCGFSFSAGQAIAEIKQLKPRVVLMDINLGENNGIDLTEGLLTECPSTRVLMLSGYFSEQLVSMAYRVGAAGYISKRLGLSELKKAISHILTENSFYLSPEYRDSADVLQLTSAVPSSPLTRREMQILKLIVSEHSTKEIAVELGISEKTVRNHKSNIMQKLGINSDVALVKYAYNMALI